MDFKEIKEKGAVERIAFLQSHAERVHEDHTYIHQFSELEMEDMRKEYIEVSVSVRRIEEEKAEALSAFRERLKEPKAQQNDLLTNLTDGFEKRRGRLYELHDYDSSRIYMVDETGELISERPLIAPLQTSVLQVGRRTANG